MSKISRWFVQTAIECFMPEIERCLSKNLRRYSNQLSGHGEFDAMLPSEVAVILMQIRV